MNTRFSHRNMGWETFTDAVIKKLSDGRENLVWELLAGRRSRLRSIAPDWDKGLVQV